ncbi:MAG: hypothetical protein Q8T11_16485 [Elusimicrobiota bacterium]|nr:hypothetical protein [Elusimicrobiota bacterium]
MNRNERWLILAVVLASFPRGARAQAVLQRCDKPMAEAEAAVKEVAACAGSLAAASSAKAGPPPGRKEATKEIVDAATSESFALELLSYAAILAYVSGDLNACAPQPFASWDKICRNDVMDLRAARAAVGPSAAFTQACAQTDQPKSPAEAKEWAGCCGLIAGNIGKPDSCAGALRQCASNQQDCRSFVSSLAGDDGNCRLLVPGDPDSCTSAAECASQRLRCQGTALFVKAFRAKDVKACGASDYCRVLMGDGKKVIQEQQAKLNRTPAGSWYVSREWAKPAAPAPSAAAPAAKFVTSIRGFSCEAPMNVPPNRAAASAVLASAKGCYADVELALSKVDPAVSRALDEREEKLIRLGLQLDKAFDAAGPGKGPATPVKTGK